MSARGAPEPEVSRTGRMTLIQHLTELRRRLIIALLALACGFVACWVLYPQILDALVQPYCDVVRPDAEGLDASGNCRLLVLDPLEPFSVRMMIAGYGGLALAMPIVLWQAWRFITPALYSRERRYTAGFVVMATVLFAGGVALAFWTIPRALGFLAQLGGDDLVSFFSPRRYLSFLIKMALAFGLGFEFPVILTFGQLVGIIPTRTLQRIRPWAIVGIVVVGAVITPSGDPFTLLVLSGPMYAFYELSILFGVLRLRRKRREEAAEGLALPASVTAGPSPSSSAGTEGPDSPSSPSGSESWDSPSSPSSGPSSPSSPEGREGRDEPDGPSSPESAEGSDRSDSPSSSERAERWDGPSGSEGRGTS